MKAGKETEAAILKLIEDSWDAYMKKDIERMRSFFATDPDLVCIGTGSDEMYIGLDNLMSGYKRDFNQSGEMSYRMTWSSVSEAGSVAWMAAEYIFHVKVEGEDLEFPSRFTAVFEKRDDRWLIMHTHLSIPDVQQREGESFPTQ